MTTNAIDFLRTELDLQLRQSKPDLTTVLELVQTLALHALANCTTEVMDESGATRIAFRVDHAE